MMTMRMSYGPALSPKTADQLFHANIAILNFGLKAIDSLKIILTMQS